MADQLAFFIVPDVRHPPEAPLDPTIFDMDAAMQALRAGRTLGFPAVDQQAAVIAKGAFKSVGVLSFGEDVTFGGYTAGSSTYAHGYMTISLWRPTPGCCSLCGKPVDWPALRPRPDFRTERPQYVRGRGGLAICRECVEVATQALNSEPSELRGPTP
jgi:hypothetical protein